MRESDLKLEKMAALIPTKTARSEVNKYFFAKKKELEAKKKAAAPGRLTKRTQEIMRKNAQFRKKRVQALARSQRYYA